MPDLFKKWRASRDEIKTLRKRVADLERVLNTHRADLEVPRGQARLIVRAHMPSGTGVQGTLELDIPAWATDNLMGVILGGLAEKLGQAYPAICDDVKAAVEAKAKAEAEAIAAGRPLPTAPASPVRLVAEADGEAEPEPASSTTIPPNTTTH